MATPRIRETSVGSTITFGSGVTDSLIKAGPVRLSGIFISSVSGSPTLKLHDATASATGTVIQQFIPATATMYDFGTDIIFSDGLYVMSGGSIHATFFISY